MKISELIKIIEKKILSQDCITKVKIEDKSFLHKNHKSNEKEVIKMKSFVTNKGMKLTKTSKFKIKKVLEKDKERVFEIIL